MGSIHKKFSDRSRALVFKLLADCRFLTCTKEDCPIWEQRKCLSMEKKQAYAMRLSHGEIKRILGQHECCYEKRLSDLDQW